MNPVALRSHVIEQLIGVGGKPKGDEIQILCPFHDDRSPSLNVHIGHKITPGSYHCFSCHARGGWNKLASALRLTKVSTEIVSNTVGGKVYDDQDDPFRLLAEELKHNPILKDEKYRSLKGSEEIPDDFEWRGFNGRFYSRLGGSYYWTEEVEYLHFPLTVHREYRGYTLIAVNATTTKFTKYQIFAEAKKVFFLYDALPQNQPIVLTEGHFDALRLTAEGFFAAAILGVNNWSNYKKELLVAKNPSRIVIAFDGDQPGYDASVKIFEDLCDGSDVDIFYLPPQTPKLDPGDMSQEYLNMLREKVYDGIPTGFAF
jgi:hypothetical protein